jgi:hypothetical protein
VLVLLLLVLPPAPGASVEEMCSREAIKHTAIIQSSIANRRQEVREDSQELVSITTTKALGGLFKGPDGVNVTTLSTAEAR